MVKFLRGFKPFETGDSRAQPFLFLTHRGLFPLQTHFIHREENVMPERLRYNAAVCKNEIKNHQQHLTHANPVWTRIIEVSRLCTMHRTVLIINIGRDTADHKHLFAPEDRGVIKMNEGRNQPRHHTDSYLNQINKHPPRQNTFNIIENEMLILINIAYTAPVSKETAEIWIWVLI